MKQEKKSIHPFEEYIPEEATKLIIGTMPPYRFCVNEEQLKQYKDREDVNFFYGSCDNDFWEILSAVTETVLEYKNTENAIQQRKDLLNKLGVGVTDIIKICTHKDGKSDDASLKNIQFNDLKEILKKHPNIHTLLYTSEFVKTLVNQSGIADKTYHDVIDKEKREYQISVDGKSYKCVLLYSPSPSAIRALTPEKRLAQYKEVFKN